MSDSSDDANFAWFWCVKGKMQENHKSSQLFSLPGSRENFWQIPVAVCNVFPYYFSSLVQTSKAEFATAVVARIPLSISFSTTFQLSCCYYCNPFNLGKSVRWFISTIRDRGRPDKEQRRAWAFYVLMVRKLKTIELDGCLFIKYLHPKSICRIDS